jgi:hypothetical protein
MQHSSERDSGWSHTASPVARFAKKFVAFLSQIWPRGPFLPVVSVYKYCTVNNLRLWLQHGMEAFKHIRRHAVNGIESTS